MDRVKTALKSWEIWRLPFNVILFGFGLKWSWPLRATMVDQALLGYWGSVLAFGVTANVFFTLGPALDVYLLAFRGVGAGRWRTACFVAGLLIALFMTWSFVWSMEILYTILYPYRGGR